MKEKIHEIVYEVTEDLEIRKHTTTGRAIHHEEDGKVYLRREDAPISELGNTEMEKPIQMHPEFVADMIDTDGLSQFFIIYTRNPEKDWRGDIAKELVEIATAQRSVHRGRIERANFIIESLSGGYEEEPKQDEALAYRVGADEFRRNATKAFESREYYILLGSFNKFDLFANLHNVRDSGDNMTKHIFHAKKGGEAVLFSDSLDEILGKIISTVHNKASVSERKKHVISKIMQPSYDKSPCLSCKHFYQEDHSQGNERYHPEDLCAKGILSGVRYPNGFICSSYQEKE